MNVEGKLDVLILNMLVILLSLLLLDLGVFNFDALRVPELLLSRLVSLLFLLCDLLLL